MVYRIAATVLLGLVYLISTATGLLGSLLCAAAVGIGAGMLERGLGDGTPSRLAGPVAALAATGLGATAAWSLSVSSSAWSWLGLPVAAGSAWVILLLHRRSTARTCSLCRNRLHDHSTFDCPRCSQTVCGNPSCWSAKDLRCTRCGKREIIILPLQTRWWTIRFGRRVEDGECSICMKPAANADLRQCGECHWTMCTRCWDHLNGRCEHCSWTAPDLPPPLQALLVRKRRRSSKRAGLEH